MIHIIIYCQIIFYVEHHIRCDLTIWEYAKENDFTIATKDSDFVDIVNIKGFPPYLVWMRSGNVRVKDIENTIRNNAVKILNTFKSKNIGIIQVR